jgi:uncharacterized protein (DUF2225 family)
MSRLVKYPQGTVLDGTEMHVLFQGEAGVVVSRPGEHRLAGRLNSGDFFCEASLFLQSNEPFNVIALTDIVTLPLRREDAMAFFSEEPAFAFELCRALCERLHGGAAATPQSTGDAPKPVSPEPQVNGIADAAQPAAVGSPVPSGPFPLFPEGYSDCSLPLNNADRDHLMEKSTTCPLCGQSFRYLAVRSSKLVLESTDSDMRPRYKEVEPLYYEVMTCPHCLYSALSDTFDKPGRPGPDFVRELSAIKEGYPLHFGEEADADSVFAGYYLALHCAPHCFTKPHMTIAKLHLKLSRIYQDAGNSRMETFAAQEALDAYMYVYQNIDVPASQDQQLCLVIAELSFKLGRFREAKDFFFKVKVSRNGAPLLKRQAENRLYEIRESGN